MASDVIRHLYTTITNIGTQILEILLTIVYQASVVVSCIEKLTYSLHNYSDLSVKSIFGKVDQNNVGKK
jgi:hypothetical protein